MKRRTVDHAPGLPAASFARTRQYRFEDGRLDVASCEGVTVWSTSVDEKLFEVLIWIS